MGSTAHEWFSRARTGRRALALLTVTGTAVAVLVTTPAAEAGPETVLTAERSVDRACHAKAAPEAAGVDSTTVTAPVTGLVQARLDGAGDWDVAVYDTSGGEAVAGSAGSHSNELAEGFVHEGQELLVQGCRVSGAADSTNLELTFLAIDTTTTKEAEKVQVVEVATPTRSAKNRLQGLGLDLTEHGTADALEVVLHGSDDAQTLRDAGFEYDVRIADLAARNAADRRADATYAAAQAESPLPSGSTGYRHLADYEYEMKALADQYPSLTRPITLNHPSVEGRDIQGLEITTGADNISDGKPVFVQLGVHHAREWPSSEHAMEWAYDLLRGYGKNKQITSLVRNSRTIVVPVVNVDGFTISREAEPLGDFSLFDYEMKRKNCSISESTPAQYRTGTCEDNKAGRLRGTDVNRNYGAFWGGAGASVTWSSDTFRGDAPFSEPESQNIRELVSNRQVTGLITNHTYSNLVLRPPGIADTRPPLEEPELKALGAAMTSHNGYANIPGYGLYDTSGTTEDWSFWVTGGYGYTFEIGPDNFHPPYEDAVVGEYLGLEPAAGAGRGGNRAAYLEMADAVADPDHHATLKGSAPKGVTLRVHKEFMTATSPVWNDDFGTDVGDPILFEDSLDSTFTAPGGSFTWAVNPSTRPVVAGRLGRDPVAPPQADFTFANPAGIPATNTGDPVAGPHEEIPFTLEGPPDADNGKATVHIQWANPATDWDLYILNSEGAVVGQSAAFGDVDEDAVMLDPPAGDYTAVVVNYDGGEADDWSGGALSFESPQPTVIGPKEAWTFTCENADGTVRNSREVIVDRGETANLGTACARNK
ncbi:MAG: M14 family metallopeptidase [Actinomycetes bacterium]